MTELKKRPSIELIADIRANLKEQKIHYEIMSKKHQRAGGIHRMIYFVLGGTGVILSAVCSTLSAGKSAVNPDDGVALAIFMLALISTVLSAICNFFGIEEKIAKYGSTKLQYKDMSREIDVFNLSRHTERELIEMENILLEKEKFCRQYEVAISPCFE